MAYVEVDEPIVLDSTGQDIKDSLDDIKSAVQGLGTALGADKANISGDNIASPATFRQNIGVDYVDISSQIGVFNNRVTISVLRAYRYSNGKIEIYVKGNIATNLSSGQTTIMTLPLTLTYGFDTFSGTASLNSNVTTVSTAGTSTTGYIDLKHSGASSGDHFSFFISWFI